jgi:hypothetical protein
MKRQQPPSPTSSTGSRPQKLLCVESDSLGLTDRQYEEMDTRILSYPLIPAINPPIAPFAIPLLSIIVCEAYGLLNQEYCSPGPVMELIDRTPQLVDELEAALEERKFARIRSLSELLDMMWFWHVNWVAC